MPERLIVCQFGHDDWVTDKRGHRACRTCRNARNSKRRRRKIDEGTWSQHKRMGDRGPREETFSRSEILRARGYEN